MKHTAVMQFVIVPPFHKRDKIAAVEKRFAEYLTRRFRGYEFRIAGFAPVGDTDDDEFHVLPVMNFIDDEGRSRMCDEPQRWVMTEIGALGR
jgi:predicted deacetylase